jgi:hypothetical protein
MVLRLLCIWLVFYLLLSFLHVWSLPPPPGVPKYVGRKLYIDYVYFWYIKNMVRYVEFDITNGTYNVKFLPQYLNFTVTVIATIRIGNNMA